MKQLPYNVPDNYFDNLKTRLSEIPDGEKVKRDNGKISFVPYLSLFAAFVGIVTIGTFILSRTTGQVNVTEYDNYRYADLLPLTEDFSDNDISPYNIEKANSDDLIDYFIETQVSFDNINYDRYEQNH